MSNTRVESQRWQLRVLTGPLRGTVHELRQRTSLGRAASSVLQLVDAGISRQHAMVVEDDKGRHVLIDLASANGTFVDGRRIERHLLEPGKVFTLVDTEIVYEPAKPIATTNAKAPSPNQLDGHTLRATTQLPCVAPEPAESRPTAMPVDEVLAGPERHPLRFTAPDGTEHGGSLIEDIIDYRRMRAQYLRGGLGDPVARDHFLALQDRLRQPPAPSPASQRAFCRFECWFPAAMRFASGVERPCWVRDLGVDGAQVRLEHNDLRCDTVAWLALTLVIDGRSRVEVLTSRVVWTDDELAGLAFAGPPRSEDGRYNATPRVREEIEDTRPIQAARPRLMVKSGGGG